MLTIFAFLFTIGQPMTHAPGQIDSANLLLFGAILCDCALYLRKKVFR